MNAKVVEVDKSGVGYVSYKGVLNAKGDIIIRTDADVIMTPSAIREPSRFSWITLKSLLPQSDTYTIHRT